MNQNYWTDSKNNYRALTLFLISSQTHFSALVISVIDLFNSPNTYFNGKTVNRKNQFFITYKRNLLQNKKKYAKILPQLCSSLLCTKLFFPLTYPFLTNDLESSGQPSIIVKKFGK